MKVRFQADNDLHRAIVRGVLRRSPTADFQSQPLNAVDDLAVLHMAAEAGRMVVSHDVSRIPQAFAEFRRTSHSPGGLLTPQSWAIAEVIGNLVVIWEVTEASEWQDRICYLATLAEFRRAPWDD